MYTGFFFVLFFFFYSCLCQMSNLHVKHKVLMNCDYNTFLSRTFLLGYTSNITMVNEYKTHSIRQTIFTCKMSRKHNKKCSKQQILMHFSFISANIHRMGCDGYTSTLCLITLDLCIDSSSFPDHWIFNVHKNYLYCLN